MAAALAGPAVACADEVWLIADANCVNVGEPVWVSVANGPVFPIGETGVPESAIARFVDRGPNGARPFSGLKKQDLNLSSRQPLSGTGVHVLGCAIRPHAADVPQSDRLHKSASEASATDDSSTALRFAKTIVSVEPVEREDRGYWTPLGHALEIVPLTDPCEWRTGESVGVQVVVEGRPRAGIRVHAGREGEEDSSYKHSTTTDATGLASIPLGRAGHWFLLAELRRGASGDRSAEELRATLTFRVRGQNDVGRVLQAVRAIHGGLDPAAVAGYRMGTAALEALGLASGSNELHVTHRSPQNPRFAGALGGLQAATRATGSRLNFRADDAGSVSDVQSICINRATGQRVICRLRPALRRLIESTVEAERRDAALRVAVMPNDWVFELERRAPKTARTERWATHTGR